MSRQLFPDDIIPSILQYAYYLISVPVNQARVKYRALLLTLQQSSIFTNVAPTFCTRGLIH